MFPFVFEINPAGWVHLAVHIAYDITAGLSYGKLGKEFGYSPEFTEAPDSTTS
jgi:hypothetical protein